MSSAGEVVSESEKRGVFDGQAGGLFIETAVRLAVFFGVGLQLAVFLEDGVEQPSPSIGCEGQLLLRQFPLRILCLEFPVFLS